MDGETGIPVYTILEVHIVRLCISISVKILEILFLLLILNISV
jgi:hypothetical protein